jgi:inosine-uridine nucleoside N-ribohydrolase
MNLIIETDLGHDPDDFFAILWLISIGVSIRAICVTPGDPDQLAIANLIVAQCGLNIPVGTDKLDRTKLSSGGMHHALLKKYGCFNLQSPENGFHNGLGEDIVKNVVKQYPDSELFIIGPVTSVGKYLRDNPSAFKRSTMQGGFLGYNQHNIPCERLAKFEGLESVPTFNLNGDRKGAMVYTEAAIRERRWVGKHVCHTIVYNSEVHARLKPHNRASELFKEGMDLYLQNHPEKKFHDPTAAVCHVYPEIGTWVRGKTDYIIADVDRNLLWDHICNFI